MAPRALAGQRAASGKRVQSRSRSTTAATTTTSDGRRWQSRDHSATRIPQPICVAVFSLLGHFLLPLLVHGDRLDLVRVRIHVHREQIH